MERPLFACPKCGSKNVTQLGAKRDRAFVPFTVNEEATEQVTIYAFQCECGTGFTEMVRESERGKCRATA